MLRGPLLLATFGLALSVMLWSVPAMVAASALPHLLLPKTAPTLAQALATAEKDASASPSLPDGLIQLIGAEAEALQVAGDALRQPAQPDLAPRGNHAGARVQEAVGVYARAAQKAFDRR